MVSSTDPSSVSTAAPSAVELAGRSSNSRPSVDCVAGAVSGGEEPGSSVEGYAIIVTIAHLGHPGMQRHSYPDRPDRAPVLGLHSALSLERGAQGVRRRGESREDTIASVLEDIAAVGFDDIAQQSIVADEGGAHRLRVLFPQSSAGFDVGEKKRERPAGQEGYRWCRWWGWQGQVQPIGGQLAAGGLHKRRALRWRELEGGRQAFSDLARGPALVGLDLLDRHLGAADLARQLFLGQVERLAPPPHPISERGRAFHAAPPFPSRGRASGTVSPLYLQLYH